MYPLWSSSLNLTARRALCSADFLILDPDGGRACMLMLFLRSACASGRAGTATPRALWARPGREKLLLAREKPRVEEGRWDGVTTRRDFRVAVTGQAVRGRVRF